MRTKRDRRQTPKGTSLALGNQSSIDKMFDDWLSDATPPDGVGYGDTASVKSRGSKEPESTLNGEGTSKAKTVDKQLKLSDTARIISKTESNTEKNKSKDKRKEERKRIKNNYRVPVLNPDGTPAMPTERIEDDHISLPIYGNTVRTIFWQRHQCKTCKKIVGLDDWQIRSLPPDMLYEKITTNLLI